MVVEPEPSESEHATLIAEMQTLQSMLQSLQFERQNLSAALSERLEIECNRAKSMTRVLQQGKRSSGEEEEDLPRKVRGDGSSGSTADANGPLQYRSVDLGFSAMHCGVVVNDELDEIFDESCGSPFDDIGNGPPTYRSVSASDALADYDDSEYDGTLEFGLYGGFEAEEVAATAKGLLDPSLDPAQVDLRALRAAVATLSELVKQKAALQEEELNAALSQLSQLSVLGRAS
jgi:hypothetical protein